MISVGHVILFSSMKESVFLRFLCKIGMSNAEHADMKLKFKNILLYLL